MHRPLSMIEIESDDIGTLEREGYGDMHCCRRFARSALFIGEDNAMRLRNHQEKAGKIMLRNSLSAPSRGGNAPSARKAFFSRMTHPY